MSCNRKLMYKNRVPRRRGSLRNQRNFMDLMQLIRHRHRELIFLRHLEVTNIDSSSSDSIFFNAEDLLPPPIRTTEQKSKIADRSNACSYADKAIQVNRQSFAEVQNTPKRQNPFVLPINPPSISHDEDEEQDDYIVRTIIWQTNSNNSNVNILANLIKTDAMPSLNSVSDSHLEPPTGERIETALLNKTNALVLPSNNTRSELTNNATLELQNYPADHNETVSDTSPLQEDVSLESPRSLQYHNIL